MFIHIHFQRLKIIGWTHMIWNILNDKIVFNNWIKIQIQWMTTWNLEHMDITKCCNSSREMSIKALFSLKLLHSILCLITTFNKSKLGKAEGWLTLPLKSMLLFCCREFAPCCKPVFTFRMVSLDFTLWKWNTCLLKNILDLSFDPTGNVCSVVVTRDYG